VMLNIKVFNNINDPFLKLEWERLELENHVFPQSTYHWCATWWKHLSGQRKLHVVLVVDGSGKTLGIAPLCIERLFGVQVLRSFPIHFGDFYTFIFANGESTQAVFTTILDHVNSYETWRWVRLEQVVEGGALGKALEAYSFVRKKMTACVIADFNELQWDEYLGNLKTNFRRNVRNRLRKIQKEHKVELKVIYNWQEFEHEFEEMTKIHQVRWQDDNSPAKGLKELSCWKEAVGGQFLKNKMLYFQLFCNDIPVAYRLGFYDEQIFYDWHTSFDPQFKKYHVGQVIMAEIIKYFMGTKISKVNFMAGEYDWKQDWSSDGRMKINYMYSSPSRNLVAALLNWYHHRLRDRLKNIYHWMMKHRTLRKISRNIILLKQKLFINF
jgi:hypothetical protein